MKFIRKCPFLILLLSTGLLFSIIGLGGRKNIYATQEYDPLTMPVCAVMFTGLNEEIYPWQMFAEKGIMTVANGIEESPREEAEENLTGTEAREEKEEDKEPENREAEAEENKTASSGLSEADRPVEEEAGDDGSAEEGKRAEDLPEKETEAETGDVSGNAVKTSPEESGKFPEGRLEPLRESTHEEYLNHISADIYGDAGVKRAAACQFDQVDESYFDDALFIGDSRTVGLRDYTDLSEHADFYCETSLTIYKALEHSFKGKGTVEEALAGKDYGKIYLMVGVNELGRGTTEDFMAEYTKVVDRLHELAPEAKIFIQGIMRVTGKKHNSDAIFNNSNINARNNAIATLADNERIFYIDVNEAVCDEEGNLNAEYSHDQLHLLGMYNDLYKEFLMAHGVK